jgi:hypothetical protein
MDVLRGRMGMLSGNRATCDLSQVALERARWELHPRTTSRFAGQFAQLMVSIPNMSSALVDAKLKITLLDLLSVTPAPVSM